MTLVIFDIGSGSVGAGVAHLNPAAPPLFLYTTRIPISLRHGGRSGARLLSQMLLALSGVAERVLHEGLAPQGASGTPRAFEIFVALASPWVSSRATTLVLNTQKPVRVTLELLAELRAASDAEEESDGEARFRTEEKIEEKLFRATLNGRENASPFNKMARVAEFHLFQSFAPYGFKEKVVETIRYHLPEHPIGLHAFSLTVAAFLREHEPRLRTLFFADMGGEQTELCFVREGSIESLVSIPLGRNHLIRALQTRGLSDSAAEGMLALHHAQQGSGRQFARASEILREASLEWGRQVESCLPTGVPSTTPFFICADEEVLPLCTAALQKRTAVRPVDAEMVGYRDIFLGIEALAAHQLRMS